MIKRSTEPIARGVVVARPVRHTDAVSALAKETLSILKAVDTDARIEDAVPPDADFVVLLVEDESDAGAPPLPDLKDRAATVAAVAEDVPLGRASVGRFRKRLRNAGASLGARELVLQPGDFGYLGLESDGLREKLEILVRALVVDAERLRLKREGWEEPYAKDSDLV